MVVINFMIKGGMEMGFCKNCGSQCDDGAKFCVYCGAALENSQNTVQQMNNQPIVPRSIPLSIVLTIVTCGIYGIYWMIKLNDEVNYMANEPTAVSGAMVFLLTIVTCGIYGFYWMFKMGERCDRIKGVSGNSGILYLVLAVLGFSIVSYCLIQDTINKAL